MSIEVKFLRFCHSDNFIFIYAYAVLSTPTIVILAEDHVSPPVGNRFYGKVPRFLA